ncbi:hypothetical protein [uncultured Dietzia sp.]|uniref:hypothetical protein n=1 Tax=uncultured Dietzia sp. TaxID=395519 RepID=UPI0025E3F3E3|nr:hypothetical protein [uncultured Dietzia sp.]
MSSQETSESTDTTVAAAGVPRWLTAVSLVVMVVGLSVLGAFGWRYAEARSAQTAATQRDEVTDVASQVIINAFSFDHQKVDESLQQLSSMSTGDFLTEQEQWSEDVRNRVIEQKAVTTATVSNAAVEELDVDEGDAAVLVVFTAHSEREGQEDITGRQAMRVDLTRVDGQWKADAVNQVGVTVPVGQSSQSVQDLELPDPEDVEDEDSSAGTAGEGSTSAPAPTTTAGR